MAGARELLGAGEAGRSGPHNGDRLAGLLGRRLRLYPALLKGTIHDGAFDGLDGNGVVVDVERTRGLAGRRTDTTGELRKIVGRVQITGGFLPVTHVDEIVPIRDLVIDGASGMTIRDTAVHAARGLAAGFGFRQRQYELAPMTNA